MQRAEIDESEPVTKPVPKWPGWVVIGLTLIPIIPFFAVLSSRNASWLEGRAGVFVWISIMVDVAGGLIGGIVLAAARRNPVWLIASLTSLCAGFYWLLFAMAMGMAHMH